MAEGTASVAALIYEPELDQLPYLDFARKVYDQLEPKTLSGYGGDFGRFTRGRRQVSAAQENRVANGLGNRHVASSASSMPV